MTSAFLENYQFLTRYNRWMNQRLYAVCDALTDEQRKADRGAFFQSIHQTLTHFFNHQTHHRGQVTALLSQAGVDIGVTDLVALV